MNSQVYIFNFKFAKCQLILKKSQDKLNRIYELKLIALQKNI